MNNKKQKIVKTLVFVIVAIIAIPIALFIGKTKMDGWYIEVERPLTATLFYCTIIAGMLEG